MLSPAQKLALDRLTPFLALFFANVPALIVLEIGFAAMMCFFVVVPLVYGKYNFTGIVDGESFDFLSIKTAVFR